MVKKRYVKITGEQAQKLIKEGKAVDKPQNAKVILIKQAKDFRRISGQKGRELKAGFKAFGGDRGRQRLTAREKYILKLKYGRARRPRVNFVPQAQPQRPMNWFAKDQNNIQPTESVMDMILGGEGENLISQSWNAQLSVSLPELSVGDIVSSVTDEVFGYQQPRGRKR